MAIGNLSSLTKFFRGSSPGEQDQDARYSELLLIALAQASIVDANIHPLEIEKIQQIMRRETGEELTEVDIRRASRAMTYTSTSLDKHLRRARAGLNAENKVTILKAILDVIRSDAEINVLEIDYYNQVASTLRVSPAQQAGLTA